MDKKNMSEVEKLARTLNLFISGVLVGVGAGVFALVVLWALRFML